jgi:Ca2+-binding RTX toxin-like protein
LGTFTAADEIDGGAGNDTLNATLNRTFEMDVRNVENININWDGFAAPLFNLDSVDGATVSISSTRTGYLGNAEFSNVADNSIVAGAGIVGTLTVGEIEDASVTASVARTIDINTADGAITVNAGAAETVDVDGAEIVTVTALEADDIDLQGAFDVATVTLGVDADAVLIGANDAVVNLNSDEDITVTIDDTSVFEVLNLGGEGTIDLDLAMAFDGTVFTEDFVLSNGGDITLSGTAGAADLSGIEHTVIRLATAGNGALTVGADANLVLEAGAAAAVTFQMNEDLDTAADSMTLTLEAEQGQVFNFDIEDQEIENVTIVIAPNDDFDADDDNPFTIDDLHGSNAEDGPATSFTIVSDDDDVNVELDDVTAATVDASGVAGDFTATQNGDEDMTVFAAAGATIVTFEGTTTDSTFISGNDADDEVTFVTTTGTAVAQFAGGNNTVTTTGTLDEDGTIAVISGDGDDTVTIDTAAEGTISLLLGDGDNEVTLDGLAATASVSLVTGDGDDTLTFEDTDDGSTLSIDLGSGTNTLVLDTGADISAADLSISGLDVIQLTDDDITAVVDSSLIHNQEIILRSEPANPGTLLGQLNVVVTAASLDASGVTVSDSVSSGALGLIITTDNDDANTVIIGTNGADEITGEDGDDTITGGAGADELTGGLGADTFVFAATAAGNGVDSIVDFTVAHNDAFDFTAFLTTFAVANVDAVPLVTSDDLIEDQHVFVVNFDGNINGKDYGGAEFADLWDAADDYLLTTTVDAEAVVVVQGDDETHVYYVTNDGLAAIDADDVTQVAIVGSIDNTATLVAATHFIA